MIPVEKFHGGDTMTCEQCKKSIEPFVKYCHWCGHGPKKRGPAAGQVACSGCRETCAPVFSYCPWCGYDREVAGKPRKRIAGFRLDLTCPECEGGITSAMEYCPWCDEDLDNASFAENCACISCGSQIKPEWHFCIYCGGYAESRQFPLGGPTVFIEKNALFFLTLATMERHREKQPKSLSRSYGEDEGVETVGFLFGRRTRSSIKIHHIYPVAAIDPDVERLDYDSRYLDYLKTSFESYQNSLCPPLSFTMDIIGSFHSVPNSEKSIPGIKDYESLREDSIGLIVALRKAQGEKTWQWNPEHNALEGCAGKLFFRIGAYRRLPTGVMQQAKISLAGA
jgi:hypothetical protein